MSNFAHKNTRQSKHSSSVGDAARARPVQRLRVGSFVAMCVAALLLAACSKESDDASRSSGKQPAAIPNASAQSKPAVADMPAKLCKVINELAPQAPQLSAIGTQAQLVMAVASAFDANPEALRQVTSDIDTVAIASCPASREALLKVLKMNSLQEAVR
jgi:hypothetical protein